MEASKHEWADLLMKYLRRNITPEELMELERQKASSVAKQAQFKAFMDKQQFREQMRVQSGVDIEAEWKALTERVPGLQQASLPFLNRRLIVWSAAAIIIIVIGLFARSYFINDAPGKPVLVAIRPHRPALYPFMVLPGGDTVNLHNAPDSVLRGRADWTLQNKGGIRFNGTQAGIEAVSKACYGVYNPTGEKYEIQLADGSNVVLNAASWIKIPTVFGNNERRLAASGEAYFNVMKDHSRPFMVDIDTITRVEVLGTTFNMTAYKEDPQKISLLNGAIKVITHNDTVFLHAGQQAMMDGYHPIQVTDTPPSENAIAWKQGIFEFDNRDIRSIMRELARRYEVTVRFEGDFSSMPSAGRFSRDLPLTEILKDINKLNHINAQLKEDELIVAGH